MRRLLSRLGAAAVVVAAVLPQTPAAPAAPAMAQPADGADLAVTMTWIGHGVPRAAVGETATFAITLTNLGPDTAVGTLLGTNEADQLNFVSLTCSDLAACIQPGTEPGPGADLAPGASVTATLVEQVCCFPRGESRRAPVGAGVAALTPDPDATNDNVTVVTRIVGPHGFSG